MKTRHTHLVDVQQLVTDLAKVERNHSHLQSDRHENVAEHSYDESLFVWTADKMQAKILGEMDNWRLYAAYGVTWEQYCKKSEEFLKKCSPYLKDFLAEVYEHTKKTYYDRPLN